MKERQRRTINIVIKVLAIICFLLISLSIFLLSFEGARGYELSIYAAVTPLVWTFLISSIVVGITIVSYSIYQTKNQDKSAWWLIGFLIIVLSIFTILLMPSLKGYAFYGRGDPLSHRGYIIDILATGRLPSYNFYPITHTLVAFLSLISNMDISSIMMCISQFFSLLYIIFIYILAKTIFYGKKKHVILATTSSTVPLFGSFQTWLVPHFLSTSILPLLFWLYFKERSLEFRILLIILIILLPFFHPVTSLFFTLSLITLSLFQTIESKFIIRRKTQQFNISSTNMIMLSIISFVMWSSNFYFWGYSINRLFRFIKGEVTSPLINTIPNIFEKLHLRSIEIVQLFFRLYGHILVFLVISTIIIIFTVKNALKGNQYQRNLFLLSGVFFVGVFLQISHIAGSIGLIVTRSLNYIVVLSPVFVGCALASYLFRIRPKKNGMVSRKILIFSAFIISSSFMIGIFSVFPSPFVYLPNAQITYMEMEGVEWFYRYKSSEEKFIAMGGNGFRFADAILGHNNVLIRQDMPKTVFDKNFIIPDHFGYTKSIRVENGDFKNVLMFISKFDEVLYTTGAWKRVGRFNECDFDKLPLNQNICKLYTNSDFRVYLFDNI